MRWADEVHVLLEQVAPADHIDLVWTNPLGGRTYRLTGPLGVRYLKVTRVGIPASHIPTAEAERMRWIQDDFPVPSVLSTGQANGISWLLTTELVGIQASDPRWSDDPARKAQLLGRAVRAFHESFIDRTPECPWSWRIADRIHRGTGSARAKAMLETAPAELDLVVSHGDICAPNILLHLDGQVAGVVDVGKAGVADRAADLGCQAWSLSFNNMAEQTEEFLGAYGFTGDPAHVEWYRDFYAVV